MSKLTLSYAAKVVNVQLSIFRRGKVILLLLATLLVVECCADFRSQLACDYYVFNLTAKVTVSLSLPKSGLLVIVETNAGPTSGQTPGWTSTSVIRGVTPAFIGYGTQLGQLSPGGSIIKLRMFATSDVTLIITTLLPFVGLTGYGFWKKQRECVQHHLKVT